MAFTEDGAIVGCYGLHLRLSNIARVNIAWAIDIMVVPSLQGQGVLRILVDFATTQLAQYAPVALCVMANERADGAHVHDLKWSRVNVIKNYTCSTASFTASFPGLVMTPCDEPDNWGANFTPRFQARPLVSTLRSGPFLHWRYRLNPWYQYSLMECRYRDQPLGLLVMKRFQDSLAHQVYGDIVDILWREDDPDGLRMMLGAGVGFLRTQGVPQATIWLQTNTILDQVGQGLGFAETNQKRHFCCKKLF